jgi:molybdopterin-binding protein
MVAAVSTYKMGQAAELLGVSVDTVRRWADAGRIETVRTTGGHRLIDGVSLAEFAVEMASNHPTVPVTESARNHFIGLVTDVVKDGVMAHVKLQAGPFRISSLISREAVDELNLAPGMLAVASVKATNVVIELPPASTETQARNK